MVLATLLFDDALGALALVGIGLIIAAGLAATYLQARTPSRQAGPTTLHPPEQGTPCKNAP